MDQIISQLITQWGTFGLIVVLVGYTIYDNIFKCKDKKSEQIGCQKGDLIRENVVNMKELLNEKLDHISDTVMDLNSRMYNMNEKLETRIDDLEDQIRDIPSNNLKVIANQAIETKNRHDKQMEDLFKLGPELHKIMALYNDRIGSDHIFLGSFHNGNSSLSGIPYYKFDIIAEKFKTEKIDRDIEFAHMYKDADILRYDSLPIALVQNRILHFVIDENKKSELAKYDDIIFRRMIGRDIKQIALCLLKDSQNKPSGFIGCVSYSYNELNINELSNCGRELEVIYHASEK